MKKSILFLVLCLSLKGNLLGQSKNDVIRNPVTKEYFLNPLKEELMKEHPFIKIGITSYYNEELKQEALKRVVENCADCFKIRDERYSTSSTFESQKSLAANNIYKINFKDYITVRDFIMPNYVAHFLGEYGREPSIKDFKTFKSYYSSKLKKTGFKKKTDKEFVYNSLVKKREELGKKLVEFYNNYDYQNKLIMLWGKRYLELYKKSNYPSDKLKKLVIEKISPHFNPLDNILIYPEFTSKVNTKAENEELKKMLLDEGLVKIEEWQKPRDGYTFIFPKPSDELKERLETLRKYFSLKNTHDAKWFKANRRILKLWYGNLGNEFTLQNFLKVCGKHVPSKEAFLADEYELKELIEVYVDDLIGGSRVGGSFLNMDEELKMYPKEILFHNIVKNHYGVKSDELKQIRKEQYALKEKEESEKGGDLRGNIYYKINSHGKFDKLNFWSNLSVKRKINQSEYWGKYEKKSGNIYKITLTDQKTGIKLPEFEARLSSNKTKLYLGEDKVPYVLDGSNGVNCLKKNKDIWYSVDGKESFSTAYRSTTWESSITGGIEAEGSLYKISNNEYAFVIYKNSWGGKIENNLIIITTSDNCNTIYYGKGKKKMVVK